MTQTSTLIKKQPAPCEIEHPGRDARGSDSFDIPKEVVVAFRDGEHRAFETIYMNCAEPVRGFFRMVLRNDDLAEELCQELFVRIWENRDRINPELNFRSYIKMAAKSSAMDHLRHKQVADKYTTFRLNNDIAPDVAPDEPLIVSELQMLVALALDKMPEQRRRVFEMSREENLTNAMIADVLGISESTVRVHLHKALRELGEIL